MKRWIHLGLILFAGLAMGTTVAAQTGKPASSAPAAQTQKVKRSNVTPASDIATAVRAAAKQDCGCGQCASKGCTPCHGKNCYYCAAKALATKECGCGKCDAKGCQTCGPGCDVCKFHLAPVAKAGPGSHRAKSHSR